MKIKATQKFVRMSPRKLRLVADMIRDLSPKDAAEILPQIGKRAGLPLSKVVKTAIANANVQGIADTDLVFAEIQINEGPSLKRGRPVSRGRWHPFKRRMSHIRIVLESKDENKSKGKFRGKIRAPHGTKIKRVLGSEARARRGDTTGMKSLPTVSKTKDKKVNKKKGVAKQKKSA